jgi:hypothetical protein
VFLPLLFQGAGQKPFATRPLAGNVFQPFPRPEVAKTLSRQYRTLSHPGGNSRLPQSKPHSAQLPAATVKKVLPGPVAHRETPHQPAAEDRIKAGSAKPESLKVPAQGAAENSPAKLVTVSLPDGREVDPTPQRPNFIGLKYSSPVPVLAGLGLWAGPAHPAGPATQPATGPSAHNTVAGDILAAAVSDRVPQSMRIMQIPGPAYSKLHPGSSSRPAPADQMADFTTLPRFSIAATSPAIKQLPTLPTTRQGLNVIVEAIEHVVGREVAAAVSRDNPQPSSRPAASSDETRRPDTINAGDVRHAKRLMQKMRILGQEERFRQGRLR